MFFLYEHHNLLRCFICSRSKRAMLAGWVIVLAALAALSIVFLRMGAPAMNGEPWDSPMFLDGAWRILHGQVPHRDFFSYFGDFPFYIALLGMKLGNVGMSSLAVGNIFVMLGVGMMSMTLLTRRTSAFYATVFTLFAAMLAVTPRPLGDPFDYTAYAMVYSRYGEAFLTLLGVWLFVAKDDSAGRGWRDAFDAVLAGLCMALLFFCKMNYFFVSAFFFVAALGLRSVSPGRGLIGLVSAGFFLAVVLHVTHIQIGELWSDFKIALNGQSADSRLGLMMIQGSKAIFLLLALAALGWEISRHPERPWPLWRTLVVLALIFGSEVALVSTNAQRGELPLLALAGLCAVEMIRRQSVSSPATEPFTSVRNFGAGIIFLCLVLPTLGTDVECIRYALRRVSQDKYFAPKELADTPLRDFHFVIQGVRYAAMQNYVASVDEGMTLLRRHADPNMRLASFLFSNPYQVALKLPPAEGGVVCWSWTGFTTNSHPPLKRMVGNANYILTGTGPELADQYGARIIPFYSADWDALHLETVEKTEHFTLFKVPDRPAPHP